VGVALNSQTFAAVGVHNQVVDTFKSVARAAETVIACAQPILAAAVAFVLSGNYPAQAAAKVMVGDGELTAFG
jgi:hypothetical protein